MKIDVVLTDDWELRGDGSGDPNQLQIEPLQRLTALYERLGVRGSFNAEVLQQLAHRRCSAEHPHLGRIADAWDEAVLSAYGRGHDIQLHVHPQWTSCAYDGMKWSLTGSWSLLDYSPGALDEMLGAGIAYLKELLAPLAAGYQPVTFRSGSWCIAPGAHPLPALVRHGIQVDTSIVAGVVYDTAHVKLDYRSIEESFRPYFPQVDDARRVSTHAEPIVCVPTHSYNRVLWPRLKRALIIRSQLHRRAPDLALVRNNLRPSDYPIRAGVAAEPAAGGYSEWSRAAGTARSERRISDLSDTAVSDLKIMLGDIKRRARLAQVQAVPVVLENHTKDLGMLAPVQQLVELLRDDPTFEIITLGEMAAKLQAGQYPVRVATSHSV